MNALAKALNTMPFNSVTNVAVSVGSLGTADAVRLPAAFHPRSRGLPSNVALPAKMALCVEAAAESLRVLHCQRQIVIVSALVVYFVIVAVAGEASEKLRAAAVRAAPSIRR